MIQLAYLPTPHVNTAAESVLDMFSVNSKPENMQCAIPAAEVIHSQCAALKTQVSFISSVDWDALFAAVQTRMENCVSDLLEHPPMSALQDQKIMVKKALVECAEALRLLHTSLSIERQSQERN